MFARKKRQKPDSSRPNCWVPDVLHILASLFPHSSLPLPKHLLEPQGLETSQSNSGRRRQWRHRAQRP